MCFCPQTGQVHSYSFIHPLFRILFLLVYFLYGCLVGLLSLGYFALLPRPVLGCVLGTVSLGLSSATACSGCPFVSGVLLPLCFPCGSPFGVLRGSFLLLLLLGVSCLVALLVLALGVWGCCGLARSLLALPPPSPPPLVGPLAPSGPVSALLVPPSGYLVVSATVRLSYLWYGVLWLIGSYLHSSSWQQRLRPCVGLCPLHHVGGVVQVPLAPALRYSPLGDPEPP